MKRKNTIEQEQELAEAAFEKGLKALKYEDYDDAVYELFKATRLGFTEKNHHKALADALLKRGLKPLDKKNTAKAEKLFEKANSCRELTRLDMWMEAALLGHLDSAEALRREFSMAVSTTPEAKALTTLLLNANYPKAWYDVGICYEYGMSGYPANKEKAIECLKKAEKLGYEKAASTIENIKKGDLEDKKRAKADEEFRKKNPPLSGAEKEKAEKELTAVLHPLLKKATLIVINKEPAKAPPPATQIVSSHAGGLPYFEEGEQWPYMDNGEPYEFIFQICQDAKNSVILPQGVKILQLFYDWENQEEHIVLYDKINIDMVKYIKSPIRKKSKYIPLSLKTIDMLPEYDCLYSKEVYALAEKIHPGSGWQAYNKLTDSLGYTRPLLESYLGGYTAEFEDYRTDNKQGKNHHNLFQLYLEEEGGPFGYQSAYDALLYGSLNIKTKKFSAFLRPNYD